MGTILKIANHEVKIFNFLERDYTQEIITFKPHVVGITCSSGPNLVWIDKFARFLKKELKCLILLGGPHVTLLPEQTLETTIADYVFIGEADFVLLDLINFLEGKISRFPEEGICYKKNGKIIKKRLAIVKHLEELPVPNHTFLDIQKYKSISVEVSRGCSRNCSFCVVSGYKKQGNYYWRPRPISAVIKELEQLLKLNLTQNRIYFVDLDFTFNISYTKKLLQELIKRNWDIPFWTGSSIFRDKDLPSLLKKSKCQFFYVGLETGASSIMKKFSKLPSKEKIIDFFYKIKNEGISTVLSIMLMHPGESKNELKETLRLCKKLAKIPIKNSTMGINMIFYPHIFRPYPNTEIYFELLSKGYKFPKTFKDWGYYYNKITNGNFGRVNFTKDITKGYIVYVLLRFIVLNLRYFYIPRILTLLKERIFKRKNENLTSKTCK